MREHGWGMVSRPNSVFPVIFLIFIFMEGREKGEKRKNSAVTFIMALILKPFKK